MENIYAESEHDNLNAFIGKPNEICTESYLVIGGERDLNESQCNNICGYFKTRFARFMHGVAKASHDATAKTFCFVPVQDFSKSWTDEELYLKYGLSDEEIKFIESTIKLMR